MVKFKDFSRPLSLFQVLFKAYLFSRTFQDSLVYSSTFQACANPVLTAEFLKWNILDDHLDCSTWIKSIISRGKQNNSPLGAVWQCLIWDFFVYTCFSCLAPTELVVSCYWEIWWYSGGIEGGDLDDNLWFNTMMMVFVWFDSFNLIFQLNRGGSSWVEPVLSYDKCVLLKDHNAVTPVRLEPAAPLSQVNHSTTEPLHSLVDNVWADALQPGHQFFSHARTFSWSNQYMISSEDIMRTPCQQWNSTPITSWSKSWHSTNDDDEHYILCTF